MSPLRGKGRRPARVQTAVTCGLVLLIGLGPIRVGPLSVGHDLWKPAMWSLLGVVLCGGLRGRLRWPAAVLLLWLAWAGVSCALSTDVEESLREYRQLCAGAVVCCLVAGSRRRPVELCLLLAGGLCVVRALLELKLSGALQEGRLFPTFLGHPNKLAKLLLLTLPFALRAPRPLAIGAGGISLVGMLLTFSRAGWLGLVGGATRLNPRRALLLCALLVAGACCLTAVRGFPLRRELWGGAASATARGRLAIWREALRLVGQRPITGIGVGTFADVCRRRLARRWAHAHNLWLQLAVATGVPGALLFGCALGGMFAIADPLLQAVLVGVLVAGLFDYPFSEEPLWLLFWAICGLICGEDEQRDAAGSG